MTDVVERVARALVNAHAPDNSQTLREVLDWFDNEWPLSCDFNELALAAARAAIKAMREPTEEMMDAGWEAPSNVDCAGPLSADMRAPWQAMIDAALKKG